MSSIEWCIFLVVFIILSNNVSKYFILVYYEGYSNDKFDVTQFV